MNVRESIETLLLAVLVIGALGALASTVPRQTAPPDSPPEESPGVTPSPSEGPLPAIGDTLDIAFPVELLFLGVALFIAVLVLYHLLYRSRVPSVSDHDAPAADPSTTDGELERIADTAGNAADRISSASTATLENEVYRAWWEMTRTFATPNRGSKTPREFETLAIQAGMDEDHVSELTRLFEEIRYGGRQPTSDDERRAIDLLRRIESAYGTEQS